VKTAIFCLTSLLSVKIHAMLQRLAIHLALILLFAFTQIGVVTHEISHVTDTSKHSQPDKNTPAEQCEQCISYAKVASGLQLSAFVIPEIATSFTAIPSHYFSFQSHLSTAYAARAPPQKTSI
jgi:hypothetical protein